MLNKFNKSILATTLILGLILLLLPVAVIAGGFPEQLCPLGFQTSKTSGPSITMNLTVIKDISVQVDVKCSGGKGEINTGYDLFDSLLTTINGHYGPGIDFDDLTAEHFLGLDLLLGFFLDYDLGECEFCTGSEGCSYTVQTAPYLYHIDEETIELKLNLKVRDYTCN